jgi:hypothetical protein
LDLLLRINDENKFKIFLDETFVFYGEKVFQEFLLKTDEDGRTILHLISREVRNISILKVFWEKISQESFEEKKLKEFLLEKDKEDERNALIDSICAQNRISFFYLFEEVFCKFLKFEDFIYETDCKGRNILSIDSTPGYD